MRYVVESANLILFWLVPIFYDFDLVPRKFAAIYQYNPVAAMVLALRNVLMKSTPPPDTLLWKLIGSSTLVLLAGLFMFRSLERRFYEHL